MPSAVAIQPMHCRAAPPLPPRPARRTQRVAGASCKKHPVRRAAKLKTYLATMDHACSCTERACSEFGGRCRKVKQFLQHLRLCNFRGHASSTQLTRAELRACTPECWRCAKIASLLQLHAAQCDSERCLVCSDFRQFIYPSILSRKCPRVLMPPPPPRCPLAEVPSYCFCRQRLMSYTSSCSCRRMLGPRATAVSPGVWRK